MSKEYLGEQKHWLILVQIGPKIWSIVPSDMKNFSLSISTKKNRKWKPIKCPCRLVTVSKLFYIKHIHCFLMMSSRISLAQVHLFLLSICVLLPQIVRDCLQIILYKAFSLVHNDVIKNCIGSGSSNPVVHLCTSPPDC